MCSILRRFRGWHKGALTRLFRRGGSLLWRGVREPGTRAYYKFRRKFRLPLTEVEKIVAEAQKVPEFKDKPAGVGHGRGHGRHPLLLKVLAVLRCLGKGVDVEEVEDGAQISQYTLAPFLPAFIKWFAQVVVPREIRLPEGEQLDNSLAVYGRLGFPGAFCETDGVHLAWDACPSRLHALYNGKEHFPTVAFNTSVLHSTEIIFISDWCAGGKNDKTQAQHDMLFDKLRKGHILKHSTICSSTNSAKVTSHQTRRTRYIRLMAASFKSRGFTPSWTVATTSGESSSAR